MELGPHRTTVAGPIPPSAVPIVKKSFTYASTFGLKPRSREISKDVIYVASSRPQSERRTQVADQGPVFDGPVNFISMTETTKEILCCKFTEDMDEISAGFIDGVIRIFDCAKGHCTVTLEDDEIKNNPGPVTSIRHRPVSTAYPVTKCLIASYVNGCIKGWKYRYQQCLFTIRENRQTLGLNYHPRWSKFITYGDDCKIHMYDEEALYQERSFFSSNRLNIVDGHTSRVFASAFSPKSNHELVTGGWDDCVMFWDDRQPFAVRHIYGVHVCGEGLDFDNTGTKILTCSWQENDAIQLWDYGSCKLIETIVPDSHPCKLYCGRYARRTPFMVCGGSDPNMVRLVDMNKQMTVCAVRQIPGGVYCIDFGKGRRKPKKDVSSKVAEIQTIPRVALVTGKKILQIDFG